MQSTVAAALLSSLTGKPILLDFDGAEMSFDAGPTLLRQVERRAGLAGLVTKCLTDLRAPGKGFRETTEGSALMILRNNGRNRAAHRQRSQDAVGDVQGDVVRLRKSKTGAALWIQITDRLPHLLGATPRTGLLDRDRDALLPSQLPGRLRCRHAGGKGSRGGNPQHARTESYCGARVGCCGLHRRRNHGDPRAQLRG